MSLEHSQKMDVCMLLPLDAKSPLTMECRLLAVFLREDTKRLLYSTVHKSMYTNIIRYYSIERLLWICERSHLRITTLVKFIIIREGVLGPKRIDDSNFYAVVRFLCYRQQLAADDSNFYDIDSNFYAIVVNRKSKNTKIFFHWPCAENLKCIKWYLKNIFTLSNYTLQLYRDIWQQSHWNFWLPLF